MKKSGSWPDFGWCCYEFSIEPVSILDTDNRPEIIYLRGASESSANEFLPRVRVSGVYRDVVFRYANCRQIYGRTDVNSFFHVEFTR
jgi:hypothetical protein